MSGVSICELLFLFIRRMSASGILKKALQCIIMFSVTDKRESRDIFCVMIYLLTDLSGVRMCELFFFSYVGWNWYFEKGSAMFSLRVSFAHVQMVLDRLLQKLLYVPCDTLLTASRSSQISYLSFKNFQTDRGWKRTAHFDRSNNHGFWEGSHKSR